MGFINKIHASWDFTSVEGQYPPNWTPPKVLQTGDFLAQLNNMEIFTKEIAFLLIFSLSISLVLLLERKFQADPETEEKIDIEKETFFFLPFSY